MSKSRMECQRVQKIEYFSRFFILDVCFVLKNLFSFSKVNLRSLDFKIVGSNK